MYNFTKLRSYMAGRNVGYRKPKEDYLKEYKYELRLLSNGVSIRDVSRISGHSINTIRKIKKFL